MYNRYTLHMPCLTRWSACTYITDTHYICRALQGGVRVPPAVRRDPVKGVHAQMTRHVPLTGTTCAASSSWGVQVPDGVGMGHTNVQYRHTNAVYVLYIRRTYVSLAEDVCRGGGCPAFGFEERMSGSPSFPVRCALHVYGVL